MTPIKNSDVKHEVMIRSQFVPPRGGRDHLSNVQPEFRYKPRFQAATPQLAVCRLLLNLRRTASTSVAASALI